MFFSGGLGAVIKKYTEMQVEDSDGEKLDYFSDAIPIARPRPNTLAPQNPFGCAFERHAEIRRSSLLKNRKCVLQNCTKSSTLVPPSSQGSGSNTTCRRRIIAPIEELKYALARETTGPSLLRSSDRGRGAHKRRRSLSSNLRTLMPIEEFEPKLRVHIKRASSFSLPDRDRMGYGTTSSERQTPSTSEEIENASWVAINRRPSSFQRHRVLGTPKWFNPLSTSSTMDTCCEPPLKRPLLSRFNLSQMERHSSGIKGSISSKDRVLSWILSQLYLHRELSEQFFKPSKDRSSMLSFDFSTDITPSTINQATFGESLRAIAEDGTDVGFYECSVNADTNDKSVLVNTRSEYSIADTEYCTILTSKLDSQLNLLNETNEYTRKTKDQVIKRIIRTHRELDNLIMEIEEWVNTKSTKSTRRQSLSELGWYLANGAVLVVERIYAITSAETKFTVNTMDTDGVVCNLVCEHLCERNVSYGNKNVSELAMKQTIVSPAGSSITTHKYFTVHGQLLSLVQVGLPIVFKTMDLPSLVTKTQYLPTPNITDNDFHWRDNYMLYSRFHERKEELKSQYHLYLYNHPEFVDMVKDFLQSILMEKPEDTLNFAADFFTTFSKRQLLPPRLKRT
ncbi:cAMP dependent protein kinase regulatory subunit type I II alpha beta [Echinococcus multilocularis]|uniref:cAMP dependent protein kinase regulatory subunit type I II alpha beta n=1 Tax=Echinococcus multilocularis TaxID=6211 RepID=A0A068Y583_ECHMU|nr:cAMP dependent protein kinase regulatory subunit type I II alpha beta [Echinococcus multilocularis]